MDASVAGGGGGIPALMELLFYLDFYFLVMHFFFLGSQSLNQVSESESESRSVVSDSLRPHGLYSPQNSPGQKTGVGKLFPSLGELPNPGIKPGSPALQADSLPAELQGKPKNSGVGSLPLLQ